MPKTTQQIINESENLQPTDFAEVFQMKMKLDKILEQYPEQAENLLPALANISKTRFLDARPGLRKTFLSFCRQLTPEKIVFFIDSLSESSQRFLCGNAAEIISERPEITEYLFAKFKNMSLTAPVNDRYECCRNLTAIICKANPALAQKLLEEVLTMPSPTGVRFYTTLGKTGAERADLRPQIHKFLSDYTPQKSEDLLMLYNNIAVLAAADKENNDFYLKLTAKLLNNKQNDSESLKQGFNALKAIRENSNNRDDVDRVIEHGLRLPQNDKISRKTAYRVMGKVEELYSSVSLGERIKKSEDNLLGWKYTSQVDGTETCVLFLGGDGTVTPKGANGYLKSTESLLIKHGMGNLRDKISLYSIVYDFGSFEDRNYIFNANDARTMLMQKYQRKVKPKGKYISPDTVNPRYIKQIFNLIFLPRLTDEKGKRLAFAEARRRIRRLNIIAHCHGAYTFLKLEEMMQDKMRELGYNKTECAVIQKQLLCTAIAPYCPLGAAKSTMISFCSAKDDEVSHYNHFQNEIRRLSDVQKLKLSYFPQEKGEFLLTPSFGGEEHNFLSFDIMNGKLDRDGCTAVYFMGNVIINGIKSSLNNTPLPEIKDLLCSGDRKNEQLFDAILKNGEDIYEEIYSHAKKIAKNDHEMVKAEKRLQNNKDSDPAEKLFNLLMQNEKQ